MPGLKHFNTVHFLALSLCLMFFGLSSCLAETVEGNLRIGIIDLVNGSTVRTFSIETDSGKLYEFQPTAELGAQLSDPLAKRILADLTIASDGTYTLNSFVQLPSSELSLASSTNSFMGSNPTAVILVGLQDGTPPAESKENMTIRVFTSTGSSLKHLLEDSSWGRLTITEDTNNDGQPDIFGPYVVPFNRTQGCLDAQWVSSANALAAQQHGFNAAMYRHIIYVLPNYTQVGCDYIGYTPALGGKVSYITVQSTDTIVHEVGHQLGFDHAAWDENGDGLITGDEEYADDACSMGHTGYQRPRIFNAAHHIKAGWGFEGANLKTIASPGVYQINLAPLEAPESDATRPQIIAINYSPLGSPYYLSYRRNIGRFTNDPSRFPDLLYWWDKLSIHRPWTGSRYTSKFFGALGDGASYVDPRGLTVQQISHNDEFAAIQVTIEDRPAPDLVVTQLSVVGANASVDSTTYRALTESTITLSATIENRGNANAGMHALVFYIDNVPLPVVRISSLAAGAIQTFTSSPWKATQGIHSIRVVEDIGNAVFEKLETNNTKAKELLVNGPPTTPSLLQGTAVSANQINWSWAPSSGGFGTIAYRMYRNGGTFGSTIITNFSDKSLIPNNDYTFQVQAYDRYGFRSALSAPVTVRTLSSPAPQPTATTLK